MKDEVKFLLDEISRWLSEPYAAPDRLTKGSHWEDGEIEIVFANTDKIDDEKIDQYCNALYSMADDALPKILPLYLRRSLNVVDSNVTDSVCLYLALPEWRNEDRRQIFADSHRLVICKYICFLCLALRDSRYIQSDLRSARKNWCNSAEASQI